MKFKEVITFAILMENDKGILNKSPDYVQEKFNKAIAMQMPDPKLMLDYQNIEKFNEWFAKWGITEEDEL